MRSSLQAPVALAIGAAKATLRAPETVAHAAEAAGEAVRRLPGVEQMVVQRICSLDESLRDLLSLLPDMAADLRRVRETVEPQQERVHDIQDAIGRLEVRMADLQGSLAAVQGDVHGAVELLPDPSDDHGPVAAVRDALTGRS